ncbi:MAG: hypothetical protein LBE75_06195 [Burkholderiales bacterium]|jgi:hypothetical protein|nr:hypothetical protein [Burkholderiales bacterium]
MNNPWEMRPSFDDNEQGTRSEYRFIYDRRETKRGFIIGAIFLLLVLIVLAVIRHFGFKANGDVYFILFIFFVSALLLWSYSFYRRQLSITLDRKGMTCAGFWFNRIPSYCEWGDFSQVRATTVTWKHRGGKTEYRKFVFIHSSGKHYFLTVGSRQVFGGFIKTRGSALWHVGVGHSLSLEDAVRRFVGSIETLSEAEKEKIPTLAMTVNLGKEVKYVTYTALGMALIAYAMLVIGQPLLLGDSIKTPLYWLSGLGAAAVVYRYLRSIRKRAIMLVPALLFGAAVAFLLLPISSRLSLWLGKEERIVFSISEESDKEQRWTTITDEGLTFSVHTRPDNRVFSGLGAEKVMTLYRGPLSLTVLPRKEYHALFHKPPRYKGRYGGRRTKEE